METIHQCPQCNSQGEIMPDIKPTNETKSGYSQGEIMMDEQRLKSIETQRLTLESVLVKELNGIIKKQNDEIDKLIKQKEFLQSKLREATNGKNQTSSK